MGRLRDTLAAGRPYFIAEMSANHGNDLNVALEIVDAAAEAGADCLKVQTYTADTLTLDCDNEWFRIKGGLWDGARLYDLYKDASLPWEWHGPIKERCEANGLDFLSTPFDETAVDFLDGLGCDAFKIASFECTHIPLLEYAAKRGKTMVVSTGMATIGEIEEAVAAVRNAGNEDIVLLRCCSEYPANPSDMNLASIPSLRERLGVDVGFSDHSMGHVADVAAAALGARVIEKHFCLSREISTADSKFSMEPAEYKAMVEAVRCAVDAVGEPVFGPSEREEASLVFRRSCFASAPVKRGETFTEKNVRVVRPGYGAAPKCYKQIVGSVADRDYGFGEPIVWEG